MATVMMQSARRQPVAFRLLSTDGGSDGDKKQQGTNKANDPNEEEMTQEIVLTPGEQVVAASRLGVWAAVGMFALACAYYIGKELIPT